jgi:hypothetical protein
MKKWSGLAGAVLALAAFTAASAASVETETVPLYTSDDLDRMFGPVPAGPSEPVDKTTPADWQWVEQFIDRQYARVDADRQYDLGRYALDIAAGRQGRAWTGYYQPAAWGLGYPASTWWNSVSRHYTSGAGGEHHTQYAAYRSPYAWATGEANRPQRSGSMPRGGHGGGNGGGSGHRSK